MKSSYVDSYFELNEDPIMQSMFRRMRDKNHLVNNFTDGVERVRNRFDMFFLFYDSLVKMSHLFLKRHRLSLTHLKRRQRQVEESLAIL